MPRILQHKYRLEKLQKTKEELELKLNERRIELADVETIKDYVKDLCKLLSESPLTERKSFIKSFVRDVKVTGKEVELTHTIPMPQRGVMKDKMPVLSMYRLVGLSVQ